MEEKENNNQNQAESVVVNNEVHPTLQPTSNVTTSLVDDSVSDTSTVLTPTVDTTPTVDQLSDSNSDTPKTQVEAVSNNDEVDVSGELPSAKDAGVGSIQQANTQTQTKLPGLLDGMPVVDSVNNASSLNVENTEVVNEATPFKKKVQYFFTIIFFILVAVFIFFLPEITEFLSSKQAEGEVITTGVLTCTLERTTDGVTSDITDRFTFTNEKLKSYKRERNLIAGSSDDESLVESDQECELLYEETKALSGIEITCGLKDKTQSIVQIIDYERINTKKLTAAFAEANGVYPDYELDDDIKDIESLMRMSGFTCKRSKY